MDDNRRTGADRREFARYSLQRGVEIRDGERRREGQIDDISGGGASIQAEEQSDQIDDPLESGRYVDIDVEDMGLYGGVVIRDLEDGYAVRFELDEAERDELISDIMEHGIAIED